MENWILYRIKILKLFCFVAVDCWSVASDLSTDTSWSDGQAAQRHHPTRVCMHLTC